MHGLWTILLVMICIASCVGALCGGRTAKVVCSVGLVVCTGLLVITRWFGSAGERPTVIDRGFEAAAGYRLGAAIADDLEEGVIGDPETKLVVAVLNVSRLNENLRRQGDAYWDGLVEALRDAPVEVVRCSHELAEEAHRILLGEGDGSSLADVMRKTAESIPDAGVLVTFVGVPQARSAADVAGIPPIYAVESSPSPSATALLRQGLLRGLITFHPETDWLLDPDPSLPWHELFAQRYVFTAGESP